MTKIVPYSKIKYIRNNKGVVILTNYNLDFTLTTDIQRTKLISSICKQGTYTPKQYTQMADYILLAGNKCHPDSPFIYPEEFSNPKRTHVQNSLDELMENSENEIDFSTLEYNLRPIQPTIYKKTPRKIDRNNPILQNNLQMQQLWSEIDRIDNILACTTNYKLSKLSIALHKQQYDLLESLLPQWPVSIPSSSLHPNFFHWHAGIQLRNKQYADLDLTNHTHMAKFLKFMLELDEYCNYDTSPYYIESELYTLLTNTKLAIKKANLTPLQQDVLRLYWEGQDGKKIIQFLYAKYNKKYNQPTLSTMFNYTIAKKICTEYKEIYEEQLYQNCPDHWRICTCCGIKKLLSAYNFHRASGKPKGFSLICKECFKAKKNIKQHHGK